MTDWTCEDGLRWRALAPFGLEVDGDLGALAGAARERFQALFYASGLIVAHGQALSMDQQTALMTPIGPVVRRPQENGYISTDNDPVSGRTELSFHADAAYTEAPFAAISLHAVDVVDGASSTRFVNAEQACRTLPAAVRAKLEACSAEMISPTLAGVGVRACDQREPQFTQRARFPAIRRNPRTGRACIGVSEMHAARLAGLDWDESRRVLAAVFDHLYAPPAQFEHRWRVGDVVLWDNLTYQHARGSLQGVGRRVLQRVVAGV